MPASKFDPKLPILSDASGKQVGVCAMGPVGDDEELIWMFAWVWQENKQAVAASSGTAGIQLKGAHKLGPGQKPPFAHPNKPDWMVQTAIPKDSADYTDKKPALATAMALVKRDGVSTVVQWSQVVKLFHPPHHPPAGGPHY
jgi:hypothetical protein